MLQPLFFEMELALGSDTSVQLYIHIVLITDRPGQTSELLPTLNRICPVLILPPDSNPVVIGDLAVCVVIDVDLSSEQAVRELEPLRASIAAQDLPCLFVVDDELTKDVLEENLRQAKALRITNYITHPFNDEELLRIFPPIYRGAYEAEAIRHGDITGRGVAAAHRILSVIFEGVSAKRQISFAEIQKCEGIILDALGAWGIKPWMDIVRRHHSSTYKHSLLVTGFAVTLAQKLGMRTEDQRRIARAGLLHDIGKAFVPTSILDKPGKLTSEEMDEIRKHPRLGYDLLVQQGGFPYEVLDCVLHHHEMLDGSGYPDGLEGNEIADIVRVVTIADIFAALVEERAYRKPLSAKVAFQIMEDMGSKLDTDLLREFQRIVEDAV